jgi:hypothetical protein
MGTPKVLRDFFTAKMVLKSIGMRRCLAGANTNVVFGGIGAKWSLIVRSLFGRMVFFYRWMLMFWRNPIYGSVWFLLVVSGTTLVARGPPCGKNLSKFITACAVFCEGFWVFVYEGMPMTD